MYKKPELRLLLYSVAALAWAMPVVAQDTADLSIGASLAGMVNRDFDRVLATFQAIPEVPVAADSYRDFDGDPPDPDWYPNQLEDSRRLANVPEIGPIKRSGNIFFVPVTNVGATVLRYGGYDTGAHSVRLSEETRVDGKWRQRHARRAICGTGLAGFEIQPQESVVLHVHFKKSDQRKRVLTYFSELGTNRGEMVVLATEPEDAHEPAPLIPAGALDESTRRWYSKHLAAMNEAMLPRQAARGTKAFEHEVFRFLWLRTFDHPVVVRVEREKDTHHLVVKELDGKGGYTPGTLVRNKSRKFTRDEWEGIMARIKECSFWNLTSVEDQTYVDQNGLAIAWSIKDGARWIVEGSRGGQYHIVDRQSPNDQMHRQLGKYRELCLHLLKLSGLDLKAEKVY